MTPYYDRAGVTIYHADCRGVVPTLDTGGIDLVLTDPPYGTGVARPNRRSGGRGGRPRLGGGPAVPRDWGALVGDRTPFDPAPWLGYPRVVLWGAEHYADRLPARRGWLVWDKRCGVASDFNADCELAWTNLPGVTRLFAHLWRGVCRDSEAGDAVLHPTQKPVALMAWCIARAGLPAGSLVLDPFAGSGPVLLAAKLLGMRAIGVEIEERYCEVMARRLSQDVLPLAEAGG